MNIRYITHRDTIFYNEHDYAVKYCFNCEMYDPLDKGSEFASPYKNIEVRVECKILFEQDANNVFQIQIIKIYTYLVPVHLYRYEEKAKEETHKYFLTYIENKNERFNEFLKAHTDRHQNKIETCQKQIETAMQELEKYRKYLP